MKLRPSLPAGQAVSASSLALVLSLWMTASTATIVSAASTEVFLDAPAPARLAVSPMVLKHRAVRVNLDVLNRNKTAGDLLQFNLFPGQTFTGVVDSVESRSDSDYTVAGHLQGADHSSFVLVVNQGVMVMNLRQEGLVEVRYLGDGLHDIRQIDEAQYPPCANSPAQAVTSSPSAPQADLGPQADAGEVFDVMVVYTPAARTAAGGTAAIQALITLAFTESNTAYQQSLITPRIRLVYQAEVSYTESGDSATDLNRVTGTADGYMDEVHTLRDAYGADLVSLWVHDTNSCGIAWMMTTLSTNFASDAFSVVHWDCATGYYSFSHEMGHNMGCAHDRENASGQGLYPYSYGWRFTGTDTNQYRTIMAYAPGTRIQRFSNPNVNYQGTPTGKPVGDPSEAYNALSINNAAYTVANFRQTVVNSLGDALDAPELTWSSGGAEPWSGETTNTHDGIDAAQSGTITDSQESWFETTVTGPIILTFWWKVSSEAAYDYLKFSTNGVEQFRISGEQGWEQRTVNIPAATRILSWSYSKDGSGSAGSDRAWVDQVAYTPLLTLASALDNPGLVWNTTGSAEWFPQTTNTHDGVDAAQSGTITDNQQTVVSTTVVGPCIVSYWWKVSSEAIYDILGLYVDGGLDPTISISGEVDWTQASVSLPAGSHLLEWVYLKDESFSDGQDKGWLDQVVIITPSQIITQPVSQTVALGGTVNFSATATGSEPLNYQWCRDGTNLDNGGNVSGVTTTNLTIFNVQVNDAGDYTVVVTNAYGSITSSVAVLTVQVPTPTILTKDGGLGVSGGQFGFNLTGPSGLVVIIEASTNLMNWLPIQTNALINGQVRFSDPQTAAFVKRLYRARFAFASSPQLLLQVDPSAGGYVSNHFGFNLSGMAGQTVILEASTNLVSWTPLLTNSLLTGYYHWSDPGSTNFPQRFYRARLGP